MTAHSAQILTRLISLMMLVGGLLGVGLCQWMVVTSLSQWGPRQILAAAFFAAFVGLFGLNAWAGWGLWKGQPWAYEWAKFLLVAQIPKIMVPGFAYHFYSTLVFFLVYSRQVESKVGLDFEIGSSIAFWVSPQTENIALGVNLVALLSLILLIKAKSPGHSLPTA